jgi:5'-3' exonuclease
MTIALIDGDVLCYAACKARVQAANPDTQFVSLDENGKREIVEYTQAENRKYLEECWKNFNKELEKMLDAIFCDDYMLAVKGNGNYRDDLYPEYKANRNNADPARRNIFVPLIRKLAVAEDLAIPADGREADDMVRIWAEECRAAGIDYVICTIDKDLKCIPGKHWHMKNRVLFTVSEEQALRHYYEQLLKGDPTDNIPGVPRVGEVKAAKLLADFSNEEEYQEVVIDQYIKAYDDDWRSFLLSNGKMIHLQRDLNDSFTLRNWPLALELEQELA